MPENHVFKLHGPYAIIPLVRLKLVTVKQCFSVKELWVNFFIHFAFIYPTEITHKVLHVNRNMYCFIQKRGTTGSTNYNRNDNYVCFPLSLCIQYLIQKKDEKAYLKNN